MKLREEYRAENPQLAEDAAAYRKQQMTAEAMKEREEALLNQAQACGLREKTEAEYQKQEAKSEEEDSVSDFLQKREDGVPEEYRSCYQKLESYGAKLDREQAEYEKYMKLTQAADQAVMNYIMERQLTEEEKKTSNAFKEAATDFQDYLMNGLTVNLSCRSALEERIHDAFRTEPAGRCMALEQECLAQEMEAAGMDFSEAEAMFAAIEKAI